MELQEVNRVSSLLNEAMRILWREYPVEALKLEDTREFIVRMEKYNGRSTKPLKA